MHFVPATDAQVHLTADQAAFKVTGARDSSLNWYRANIFNGKTNVKAFTPTMPSPMPTNLQIPMPTLVLWGMGDTAFDNEQNLARLAPFVPHLTIKRYAGVSHWVAQEVPQRVATAATICLREAASSFVMAFALGASISNASAAESVAAVASTASAFTIIMSRACWFGLGCWALCVC